MRSLAYFGTWDNLVVDLGSVYFLREMSEYTEACGARLDDAPIDMPSTIRTVQSYHFLLKPAYERIRTEGDLDPSAADQCQDEVLAASATAGPEELFPTLRQFHATSIPP